MNAYDFTVKTQSGNQQALNDYRGKVLLIVNTATGCSFTPQYGQLEKLYQVFHEQGFEILDFPCNQFGGQAPGSDSEIRSFCSLNYHTQYLQFSKIAVNGPDADPLFQWLTANTTFKGFDKDHTLGAVLHEMLGKENPDYEKSPSIKWNFTKFLIDRQGEIVARFEPTAPLSLIKEKIEELI